MQSEKYYKWLGISLILASGLIHLVNAPGELRDPSPHMGFLFIDFFIATIISAIGIFMQVPLFGWGLGGLLSAGAMVGYMISRTVGLPVSGIENWGPINAYLSIGLEVLFIIVIFRLRPIYPSSRGRSDQSANL